MVMDMRPEWIGDACLEATSNTASTISEKEKRKIWGANLNVRTILLHTLQKESYKLQNTEYAFEIVNKDSKHIQIHNHPSEQHIIDVSFHLDWNDIDKCVEINISGYTKSEPILNVVTRNRYINDTIVVPSYIINGGSSDIRNYLEIFIENQYTIYNTSHISNTVTKPRGTLVAYIKHLYRKYKND